MKHISGMKGYSTQLHSQPDEEFVRLLARRVFSGPLFQNRMEHFTGLTRLAFHEFVNDLIGDTLRRASDIVNSNSANEPGESDVEVDPDEDPVADSGSRNIVTTAEEIEGYELVKTIVSEVVDPERVFMRDSQSYCAILLDDNNRRGHLSPALQFPGPEATLHRGQQTGRSGEKDIWLPPDRVGKRYPPLLRRAERGGPGASRRCGRLAVDVGSGRRIHPSVNHRGVS